jgi:ABC-type sugar transport system ATPase subunit
MSALLTFDGLGKDWFGVPAVTDLTLPVPEGAALGLIGENGAGKSTLMNMVGGVVRPRAGGCFGAARNTRRGARRMRWRGESRSSTRS